MSPKVGTWTRAANHVAMVCENVKIPRHVAWLSRHAGKAKIYCGAEVYSCQMGIPGGLCRNPTHGCRYGSTPIFSFSSNFQQNVDSMKASSRISSPPKRGLSAAIAYCQPLRWCSKPSGPTARNIGRTLVESAALGCRGVATPMLVLSIMQSSLSPSSLEFQGFQHTSNSAN